ncbi:MAG: 6-phosphogluconolactonase [Candidatus Paceibacterota bacterium]
MEIITDKEDLLPVRAGEAISDVLGQYTDRPILLLFSGGSALSVIEHIDVQQITKRVTLGVLDERFNAPPDESNFAQLEATDLYQAALARGAGAVDPRNIEGEGLDEAAAWVETTIRAWYENTGGVTIITQGIGSDGHTAGILPYPDEPGRFADVFVSTNRWVVGYTKPGAEFPERITVTVPFLRSVVTSSVVYVAGAAKYDVARRALTEDTETLAALPAGVIREMNDVLVVTDQELGVGNGTTVAG